ncbi:hypothetical protein [Cryptosporangium aurantiacum]|uniref:hypothetical protein n=1 Tax=Cryptosporangium aurantiacum TaxID=134849 RepID=UPI0011611B42|nr:hypothetical protein [Cryptosporangium aurantiacum]
MTAGPAATSGPEVTAGGYLAGAEDVLRRAVAGTPGVWPRICVWLLRLALEAALDAYWQRTLPAVAGCRNRRAQLLMLTEHAGPALTGRASYLWWALSRAGHHRSYELAPTAGELRHLYVEVRGTVGALEGRAPAVG